MPCSQDGGRGEGTGGEVKVRGRVKVWKAEALESDMFLIWTIKVPFKMESKWQANPA